MTPTWPSSWARSWPRAATEPTLNAAGDRALPALGTVELADAVATALVSEQGGRGAGTTMAATVASGDDPGPPPDHVRWLA